MSDRVRARAPGRVNLIGDHTDYTDGLALPMAIDRFLLVEGVVSDRFRLASERFDEPAEFACGTSPDDVDGWAKFVAAVAAEVAATTGIVGTVTSEIPAGGLSSSAALEIALALALGDEHDPVELAILARRAEHRATGVPTGIMDQLCIASASAGHATLIDCRTLDVDHVSIPEDAAIAVEFVEPRTLVGSAYALRHDECLRAEAEIGPLRDAVVADAESIPDPILRRRARHVITENRRVTAFIAALGARDFREAGRIMTDGHRSLRDDFECSTPTMDRAVDEWVERRGVFGARMTGGGFGGCIVALCDPEADFAGIRVRPVGGAART